MTYKVRCANILGMETNTYKTNSPIKNIIFFIWGLTILSWYTGQNLYALGVWTLRDGRKPVFDIRRKLAEGHLLVNDGMTGEMKVV